MEQEIDLDKIAEFMNSEPENEINEVDKKEVENTLEYIDTQLATVKEQTKAITTPEEVLLAQGGILISMAVSASALGIDTLLSLSIYSRYHKSKSLVASILLPFALEDACKFKVAKLEKLAHILRTCPEETNGAEAAASLIDYIREKLAIANLPTRLKDLGLTIEQLSLAVEDVGQTNLINNLPRSMSTDDLFDFVKMAY